MNALIKSATIIDTASEFNKTQQDVLIENGIISKIAKTIQPKNGYKEINLDNLHISQGWFDSGVCFGEPGFEDRETIENGLMTAGKSGFTDVTLLPNSNPVIDSHSLIKYVKAQAHNHAVALHPTGALTKQSESKDLAELYDMDTAGAVAFYDYKCPLTNPNLLKIALQYASHFNGLVCSFPLDTAIAGNGVINEHITSTKLGLKGIPNLAEALHVTRDLHILEYTQGKLHIPTISTAESVKLIREAKQKQLDVTCSVSIHNLIFDDAVLDDFNTLFKVIPPLRTQHDIDALIKGLKDGTIDMVTTDHNPLTIEDKKVEFDRAFYGSIGLETAFGALQTLFDTEFTIELLTKGKSRFNIKNVPIKVGNPANLSLFNPSKTYVFTSENIHSKSKNSLFINHSLKGHVYGIIANNKIILQ